MFDDVFMMGVDQETYQKLLEIAKKEGKSVNEVTSEALRRHLENQAQLKESRERKVLTEG